MDATFIQPLFVARRTTNDLENACFTLFLIPKKSATLRSAAKMMNQAEQEIPMTSPNPLSESDIDRLIPEFYSRIRVDPVLGPIFNDAISDWPEHLDTLKSFWSSIILGSGRYKGQPMVQHLLHHDKMTLANFERWLSLWHKTTNELLHPDQASALQAKAERIAESLRLGVEFRRERASQS